MPAFAAGAVACALFLGTMQFLFDTNVESRFGGVGESLTYAPIVFMALVALLWGTRGATLAAFLGALIAIVNTAQNEGPFAATQGLLGEPELEVQGYALAIALTGLLIAVLEAGQRNAMREARAWQTRFTAAIGAHRLLAYEWDPPSNRIVLTGDSTELVGVPPERLATLADWLALVDSEDRERVATRFDERVRGQGEADSMPTSCTARTARCSRRATRRAPSATTTASCIASSGIVRISTPHGHGSGRMTEVSSREKRRRPPRLRRAADHARRRVPDPRPRAARSTTSGRCTSG